MDEGIQLHLNNLANIARGIAQTFGYNCEVVLVDPSDPDNAVVMIENNHISERETGDPMNDLETYFIKSDLFNSIDVVSNYKTESKTGKKLKTTTVFIRDKEKKIIGLFSINYDLSDFLQTKKKIDNFCVIHESIDQNNFLEQSNGFFCNKLEDLMDKLIKEAKSIIGKPISSMKKEDKIEIIRYLNSKQFFLVKGAIEDIAERLGVTRYTVYNYLAEVKTQEDFKKI